MITLAEKPVTYKLYFARMLKIIDKAVGDRTITVPSADLVKYAG